VRIDYNRPATLACVVGVVAFAARYALTGAIENDHFIYLARALQVLHGDLPVRDFEDPGEPLAYLLSTAAAALFGPSLFVNVLLCLLFLAITSALTYVLAWRATASVAAGFIASALTIAIAPRLYNTTKVIVPIVAIWLAWRYADAPHRRNLVALAAWTAIAFLLRHDYVVYVALGNLVLLMYAPGNQRLRTLAEYALLSLLFVSPWLLYVEHYEGLGAYFASALRFVATEGRRTGAGSFTAGSFALLAVPVAAWMASFRRGPYLNRAQLASASAMLLAMDVVFLRDVLATRIPDVIAPTAVLAAAIAGHMLSRRSVERAATIALVASMAAVALGIVRLAVSNPASLNVFLRVAVVTERLRRASPDIIPDPSLAPLIDYISRCTATDQRVLVAGFGPEVPALARRPFAAGLPTWIPGYYDDEADVTRALARLQREPVAVAVLLDGTTAFTQSWPSLADAVHARAREEYAVPSINARLRVWLPHAIDDAPLDASTRLPCHVR
jgi:hypothetical protein